MTMQRGRKAGDREMTVVRRLLGRRDSRELRLVPGFQRHEALWQIVKQLPTDFQPYGKRKRSGHSDCSGNCRWFHKLAGARGNDWGVCANLKSPRAGLLTFEHQGCPQYEWDSRSDYLETAQGKIALRRYQEAKDYLRSWRRSHVLVAKHQRKTNS